MSIVEFLRARLDEDEAAARAADVKQGDPEWHATHHIAGHTVRSRRDNRPIARVEDLAGDDDEDVTGILDGRAASEHIARHDPARVLREIEAKRRIVDRAEEAGREFDRQCAADFHSAAAREAIVAWVPIQNAVADLASVYADHPDYNPEWL